MRRVLVTGAASGIGRAIAARLEADGAGVLAVDLEPDRDGPGEPLEADLTTREGNRAAVDTAIERLGGLDVVVANAGIQHVAPVEEFPEDAWDRLIALLLTSPFRSPSTPGRRCAMPKMRASSRLPRCTGWSRRRSSLPTLRRSTACSGW
jgi:NAD(P)-dependent dehydrogenase (short-subunit alcohol dehydrogenase family)